MSLLSQPLLDHCFPLRTLEIGLFSSILGQAFCLAYFSHIQAHFFFCLQYWGSLLKLCTLLMLKENPHGISSWDTVFPEAGS
jgi:hypothetical protein